MSQINRELSFSEALEAYPDNNSVRLQYARYSYEQNLLEQAERLYKEVLNRDPGDFTALINLGNLYAETSRPQLAREKYLQALDHATDTDNVYRNLCLLEHRNMNRSEAKKYFNLIQRKEIIRAVDSQIYLDLLDSGD
jgi:Flp pilus assembly protein TadD